VRFQDFHCAHPDFVPSSVQSSVAYSSTWAFKTEATLASATAVLRELTPALQEGNLVALHTSEGALAVVRAEGRGWSLGMVAAPDSHSPAASGAAYLATLLLPVIKLALPQ
jgi:hypothetical protein